MFIETHVETKWDDIEVAVPLVFIKSANVQAYPCGRRRSNLINESGSRFPFDPEARLNTEANNRKHSGLNGFTQTYLKNWDEANKLLTLSLAGYLFNVTLPNEYRSEDAFGKEIAKEIATKIEDSEATKIYANILIEDAQLFSGFKDYFTGILRDQVNTYGKLPEDSLDLLAQGLEQNDYNSYYFSGLSFSTKPLTAMAGDTAEATTYHEKSYSFDRDDNVQTRNVKQTFVSLCILEKSGSTWKIHEPARLPFIEHDTLEDSIVVGETRVRRNLKVEQNATINNKTTTADLEVTNEAAVRTTLNVQNTSNNAQANIDRADIEYADIADTDISTAHIDTATVTTELRVENENGDAKAFIDHADVEYAYIKEAEIDEADIAVLKVQGEGSSATIDTATVDSLTVPYTTGDATTVTNAGIDTQYIDATKADITTLCVQGSGSSATIDNASITNKLTVHNDNGLASIDADKIQVPYGTSANTYTDITNTGLSSPFARIAKIETNIDGGVTLQGNNVTAKGEIKAPNLYQTVSGTDKAVPIIDLVEQDDNIWQLQISRVGIIKKSTT